MFPFGQSPFKKQLESFTGGMNPKDVDKYVQQVVSSALGKSFPDFMQNNEFFQQSLQKQKPFSPMEESTSRLESHIFETHDECIVQVNIPDKSMMSTLKFSHTPYSFVIENRGKEPFKEEIKFPCSVSRKGTKAIYRNGTLEVKFAKYQNLPVTDIHILDYD
ncbi:spore gernimation protein GerT [Metabacillus iocasae]|uniref:HSP20 family molecular chaperone IbpA n=1 Tax=Priestia iocasae TaxID=2291674 RepID=A0ABS2QWD8_9BACI|nr:spore gernimation protein GerT [Metabacillus iocasae]MBM7703800.1 HSP20 family molecular chaperone IbpA [Metabacillus iocasae]